MNRIPLVILLSASVLLAAPAVLAQKSDLPTPEKREATVARASKLLEARELVAMPVELIPAFNPPAFAKVTPEAIKTQGTGSVPVRATGDRGVLEQLAERLAPTGTAILGGEAILLFGQKRLKVGDQLTITFEGFDYTLDITDIGRTTFTLRLNREEITRPIKSGK
jgi:hypothetical protein